MHINDFRGPFQPPQRALHRLLLVSLALACAAVPAAAQAGDPEGPPRPEQPEWARGLCRDWRPELFTRNPTAAELRCRHRVPGPGRFGLLSYLDVPVYQPATPMPGTHLAGVPGHARPMPWESYEEWEWRVLRTAYGPGVHTVNRSLELLDPMVAARIMSFEARLAEEGVRATRRETWRAPERQAYLFQQGRSRPGPIATATLTSWHGQLDARGNPAGRAVDYDVPTSHLRRFHEIAHEVGLSSFGHDSHDPGHVFLPLDEELTGPEIELLRTLPRVPEVTLATGLPVDRPLPPGGRAFLREAVSAFVGEPFIHPVVPAVAGALVPPQVVLTAEPQTAPPPPPPRRRG